VRTKKLKGAVYSLIALGLIGLGINVYAGVLVQNDLSRNVPDIWYIAPLGAIIGLFFAWFFYKSIMKKSEGNETMKDIAQSVREGAMAYLKRQYIVVAIFFLIVFLIFSFMAFYLHVLPKLVPFAFLTGGFFSGLAGFFGMKTATNASARTTEGAKSSLNEGLKIAFRAGAVMGLVVVGLGLFDICMWFLALLKLTDYSYTQITITMLCFGMGASSQALFARVGGGIFTKAADVGADLVGKVEAGIPEDDPRNPATIADNVGDNVGDVAGMGADLYESYCGSILASAALGVAAVATKPLNIQINYLITPMVIAGIGVFLSIIGIYLVRTKEGATMKQLLNSLNLGIYVSSILTLISSYFIIKHLIPNDTGIFWSIFVGLLAGLIIGKSTEYYTSFDFKPTQGVSKSAETGPATVIIDGIAVGMMSTWVPVLTIIIGIFLAYGLPGGFQNPSMGLYGVGTAAVGMLSTLGITLATDAYGPIADNAGGNAEMSKLEPYVRERTDALDSLGNTTAATGKGFAIGSAALTALALLAAYIEEVRNAFLHLGMSALDVPGIGETAIKSMTLSNWMSYYDVTLMNPKVLIGMFIGAMLAFTFCAMTMKAVGRAAMAMVQEVRRQFKEIKGILDGSAKPDYASCVDISTKGAQKEMILPSLVALLVPVITGLLFGVAGVLGLLAGGLATGFVLAIMMANAGGAWDNAKKYIETGKHGGKGSVAHKASVVGDTVGDPFKDTSGPSLNILIKLMSMVSVVFAGLVVKYSPEIMAFLENLVLIN
jgi:K(+)-stimulated pyrophosphate-energized sodium pump